MQDLNALPPLLIVGSLTLFMTLESVFPYFKHGAGRRRQRWHNGGMIAVAALVNAAIGTLGVLPIAWSEANSFGLLYHLTGQSVVTIVIGAFLIDLVSYTLHVTMHKVPALWRIHRVHHADTELDASSGIRLHPFELLYLWVYMALCCRCSVFRSSATSSIRRSRCRGSCLTTAT